MRDGLRSVYGRWNGSGDGNREDEGFGYGVGSNFLELGVTGNVVMSGHGCGHGGGEFVLGFNGRLYFKDVNDVWRKL